MPRSENITVDTKPMAASLNNVSNEVGETTSAVGKTTTAVEAMMSSVCAAEAAAAASVSRKVSQGFSGLIAAQISQKKIEAQTQLESKFQTLVAFSNMLSRLNKQLENDYNRITKRYSKIMEGLNSSLKNRIYELDSPAADVADQGFSLLDNRPLATAAYLPLLEEDIMSLSNLVCLSKYKDDCIRCITELKTMVLNLLLLRKNLNNSVQDKHISCRRDITMPIVVFEATDLNLSQFSKTEIVVGDKNVQQNIFKDISSKVIEKGESFSWKEPISPNENVLKKISELSDSRGLDERTKSLVAELAQRSLWKELEDIK